MIVCIMTVWMRHERSLSMLTPEYRVRLMMKVCKWIMLWSSTFYFAEFLRSISIITSKIHAM